MQNSGGGKPERFRDVIWAGHNRWIKNHRRDNSRNKIRKPDYLLFADFIERLSRLIHPVNAQALSKVPVIDV